jgi:hypothetical protein
VKKLLITTVLTTGLLTSSARAIDLSIKGNLTETLTASDNYFLSNKPSGATAETVTAGTLNFLARTPTTNLSFNTYASYYKYFGPGAADTQLTWGTPASASFNVDHTQQLVRYFAGASWTRADTTQVSLAQTGVSSGRGSINVFSANGGLAYDIGRLDSMTWNAVASKTSYTDPTAFPFTDVSTTVRWNHVLTPTTTLYSFVLFDWFSQDDPAQSQRLLWRAMAGFNSQISPRLTLTGNVGWIFGNSYQTNPNAALPTTALAQATGAFVPQVGAANSLIWDVALSYRLLKTTSVTLNASEVVVPLFTGQLQKSEQIGMTMSHAVNRLSNLSLSAQFTLLPATSGTSVLGGQSSESQFFSASASYSYQLAREWLSTLSYSYLERHDSSGIVRSNYVSFTLRHDFTLLGNSRAINVAENERAKARARQSVGYVFPGFH